MASFSFKQLAAKGASSTVNALRSQRAKKQQEENPDDDDFAKSTSQAAKRAGKRTANSAFNLILLLPKLKFGIPAALVVILLVVIAGLTSATVTTANNLAAGGASDCATDGGGSWLEFLINVGFGQEDSNVLAGDCGAGGASGGGYTGETYPPSVGYISSGFGPRPGGTHWGTDIAGGCNAPIYAWAGGTVIYSRAGSEELGGPTAGFIVIQHTETLYSRYGHTRGSTTTVQVGDVVSVGDQIAQQWSNGTSTGCHLHFEIGGSGIKREEDPNNPLVNKDPEIFFAEAGFAFPYTIDTLPPRPTGGSGPIPPYSADSAQGYALSQMAPNGWSTTEFTNCLLPLWERESNWRVDALNPNFNPRAAPTPENQAYGIVQAAPGNKMETAGSDWRTNYQTQINWGLGYIRDRYSSPCSAWAHSEQYNWY